MKTMFLAVACLVMMLGAACPARPPAPALFAVGDGETVDDNLSPEQRIALSALEDALDNEGVPVKATIVDYDGNQNDDLLIAAQNPDLPPAPMLLAVGHNVGLTFRDAGYERVVVKIGTQVYGASVARLAGCVYDQPSREESETCLAWAWRRL